MGGGLGSVLAVVLAGDMKNEPSQAHPNTLGTVWYTFGTALVHPETSKKINRTRLWYTWYTLERWCRGVAQENVDGLGPSVCEQAKSG